MHAHTRMACIATQTWPAGLSRPGLSRTDLSGRRGQEGGRTNSGPTGVPPTHAHPKLLTHTEGEYAFWAPCTTKSKIMDDFDGRTPWCEPDFCLRQDVGLWHDAGILPEVQTSCQGRMFGPRTSCLRQMSAPVCRLGPEPQGFPSRTFLPLNGSPCHQSWDIGIEVLRRIPGQSSPWGSRPLNGNCCARFRTAEMPKCRFEAAFPNYARHIVPSVRFQGPHGPPWGPMGAQGGP